MQSSYMLKEVFEQPQVLENLLGLGSENARQISHEIRKRKISNVIIAARGTSDNAARYAKYVFGAFNHLPVMLAAPSLFSMYKSPPVMENAMVIGISQSGQSPDIIKVLEEGKRQGCLTLAVTNNIESPLAREAEYIFNVQSGVEKAVAATKTYSTQLMAIALLSAVLADDNERLSDLEKIPAWISKVLESNDQIAQAVLRYRYMQQCVVLGRGFNYATAYEWSLKLKELTYVVAEPYSSADFLHGPIAMVANGFPVLAFSPDGAVFEDMLGLLKKLKSQNQAELFVISDKKEALELATSSIEIPVGIPEWLTPIVGIVPAQLFSYHLARVKGFNTDSPRGLQKVTLTK